MTVTIELTGSKELAAALDRASNEIREQVSEVVIGTAMALKADIAQRIQRGPASGRVYQKYNPRRTHQASAPGQAPMSDTGRLANNIFFDTEGQMSAVVGSTIAYAVMLEYGTRKMAARPFFTPAVEAMRPKFAKQLERAISGAMK